MSGLTREGGKEPIRSGLRPMPSFRPGRAQVITRPGGQAPCGAPRHPGRMTGNITTLKTATGTLLVTPAN
jgi:hypothetical protein